MLLLFNQILVIAYLFSRLAQFMTETKPHKNFYMLVLRNSNLPNWLKTLRNMIDVKETELQQ